jgi:hypothetical protein
MRWMSRCREFEVGLAGAQIFAIERLCSRRGVWRLIRGQSERRLGFSRVPQPAQGGKRDPATHEEGTMWRPEGGAPPAPP